MSIRNRTAKTKYVVRVSTIEMGLDVNGSGQCVLSLSEVRTYSNLREFDRLSGELVPEYTGLMAAALDYAQKHKYPIRNAALLGYAFADLLAKALTADEFAEACRLNRWESNPAICRSHDFCDANEVMLEAFLSIGLDFDLQNQEDIVLWNRAWGYAKLRMIASAKPQEHRA